MSVNIEELDQAHFDEVVKNATGPVAVDFYSTECAPCDALAPKFEALAQQYGQDVRFVKIFRQGNRALADALQVRSSPTVLFFQGGKELGPRLTGGIKRSELVAGLDRLISPERTQAVHAAQTRSHTECDVLILGAGPAGITAGIYAAQARLDTVLVDLALGGGNLAITHQVSNFPGFPTPQPGWQLAHQMVEHAKAAGVKPRLAAEVTSVDLAAKTVVLDGVETVHARRIVVATGSSPRPIGVKGEREFKGQGVSYCATCDAKYYEGKHVVVIGGGNSAVEESLFIARFAARITVVHQLAELQANKVAQEQAFAHPRISFVFRTEPREFLARQGTTVDGVLVEDLATGERRVIDCDGVFVFAGMQPNLEGFGGAFTLDRFGYIQTDDELHTNVPGVFAAGDVATKKFRQMTTAVSDGTVAAMALTRELAQPAH